MRSYNPKSFEKKWRKVWEEERLHKALDPQDADGKPKRYVLDMFPYPSGEGLHVGHPLGYIATDAVSRYLRMRGYNVLHPMGWDAFGLPAENYAIKNKMHPRVAVEQNIARFKQQLEMFGFSYDWDREINTTDPEYYKWTQWIFSQLFAAGLAYEAEVPINFCPSCKTGLANEEVVDGACERCHTVVERRNMRQWLLKITAYADRLLEDLEKLNWPEKIKAMQRNWIGRSDGVEILFPLIASASQNDAEFTQKNAEDLLRHSASRQRQSATLTHVKVFTTRPDTLFGATYVVVAPEHEMISNLSTKGGSASPASARGTGRAGGKSEIRNKEEVKDYMEKAEQKSERERQAEVEEKTGIKLEGIVAVNPANGEEIPIFVADYVLAHYGTGAIMAVPGHDTRDFAFAKKFGVPVIEVISPDGKPHGALREAYVKEGILINSGEFNGLWNEDAKDRIAASLEQRGLARRSVHYKLRDWVFSRQRYWGEPIPLVFCTSCKKRAEQIRNSKFEIRNSEFSEGERGNPGWMAVPEEQLPVLLPEVERYEPTGTGESPLAAIKEWVKTTCPRCGGEAKRETNTMPQWAGSCWYYLRYIDPKNSSALVDPKKEKYWMPVDLYLGGAEHAVLHLLYARFWHKVLFDIGVVSTNEPFAQLFNQGMILGPDGQKMSKSRDNVINPDDLIDEYGADAFRLYELFMGPLEDMKPWDTKGIIGMYRFLGRVWELLGNEKGNPSMKLGAGMKKEKVKLQMQNDTQETYMSVERLRHRTIKKVTEDIENFRFNTAISALMKYLNAISNISAKGGSAPGGQIFRQRRIRPGRTNLHAETLLCLLAPFAPHIAEELWRESLGNKESIHKAPWPDYDAALLAEDTVSIVVQVNGKVRGTFRCPKDISEGEATAKAMEFEGVKRALQNRAVQRVVFVENKLINLVS